MPLQLQSAIGLLLLLGLAWMLSENRRLLPWKFVLAGLALQALLAILFLKLPYAAEFFAQVNRGVLAIQEATQAGTSFVFGFLGGAPLPYEETRPGGSIVFAFRFLPLILLVSALAALLTYWRVLPLLVRAFAWLFERTLRIGGAVAVSSAANIFLGMVEAPILIRPYLEKLNRNELFTVMCTGLAGVAGTVLVLFATMLAGIVPDAAGHLLVASIISVPASIVIARIMIPQTQPPTPGTLEITNDMHGPIDAITAGTRQGLELFLNVLATLLVFVALVHLANLMFGALPDVNGAPLTLQRVIGWLFSPLAWSIGIPWQEAQVVSGLLGIKTALNELLAFVELASIPPDTLTERTRVLTTYALCGFANFGSVGILIAGLATMAPQRRSEIARLGLRSLIGGTLATCMTAAMVGCLI